jgi:SAM-dependent methyltransferase
VDLTQVDDPAFDALYPAAVRLLSRRLWTPVGVARRAAVLLRGVGARRVLDVGSGVGKFVLAAASAAPEIAFVGVEHQEHFVEEARGLASRLGLANVRFDLGDATAIPWDPFDAVYLFNPFAENLYTKPLERRSARVERALEGLAIGAAVLTYHGAGVPIPGTFGLASSEPSGSDWLHLWIRRRRG